MNITTLVHQAERPRTAADRRDEAVRSGELAMALSRVLRGWRHARGAGQTAQSAQSAQSAQPTHSAQSARPALTLVRDGVPAQPGPAEVPDSRECRPAC
jgi:hypothetical protein